jgi:hypothetical protein
VVKALPSQRENLPVTRSRTKIQEPNPNGPKSRSQETKSKVLGSWFLVLGSWFLEFGVFGFSHWLPTFGSRREGSMSSKACL